ncbi:MAG: serine--tRNA ligase [Candidatus Nanoarchaeia archaeon]
MLDINLIRNDPEVVIKDLEKRKDKKKLKWVKHILELDGEWKNLKKDTEGLRQHRNKVSKEISELKKAKKDAAKKMKEAADIPKKIASIEARQIKIKEQIDYYLMRLPNILHETVPVGADDEDNTEMAKFGQKPKFDKDPNSHVDILEEKDLADIARAAKISGARFWFLKGKLALLDQALQKYAIDFMFKKGYTLMQPPFMMNKEAYEGVTDLSDFEDVMYKVEDEDLYLIATSEHPLTAMFINEILEADDLPMKFAGISANFRKEAGSHGKDTKGIFRGHQFNKVEQVIICKPEDSWKFHEELINNAIDFFESLGLHFRQVNICTGDIGTVAAKKYDLEVWMPVQGKYREVVSCSNCTDYQARRLRIRYRGKEKNELVHTLNSTCVATSRVLVAILENFQKPDSSIAIPKVLQPYMNGLTKI